MDDLNDIISKTDNFDGFDLDLIVQNKTTNQKETKETKTPPGTQTGIGFTNRVTTRATNRRLYDLREVPNAIRLLTPLPEKHETIHAIMGGDFAAWDLVPAILKLIGRPIKKLHMATLGFNLKNSGHLADLVQQGQITTAVVICSDFFAKSEPNTFRIAKTRFETLGIRITSTRTHAKIQTLDFGEPYIVVESSANLRSCNNLEQVTITNDRNLLDFHEKWIKQASGHLTT